MNTNEDQPSLNKAKQQLDSVLGQSKEVKDLVDAASEDLSSANTLLRQGVAESKSLPEVKSALEKTGLAEDKVQDAADKLSQVNSALSEEVGERSALELRLTAVTERMEVSRRAAMHDGLTGLANRTLFDDRLEHEMAQAHRHSRNLAVMFIDLDGFKKVNDVHGHDAGDEVLKIAAARLLAGTREEDTVSRYGGDEFLYLLAEFENEEALSLIAQKLVSSIEMPCSLTVNDATIDICVSASIGIATFPKNGSTAKDLIKSADSAMYLAKNSQFRYLFAQ